MTDAASKQPEPGDAEELADVSAGDLDLPEGVDVTGGSLNTYVEKVTGEKQGKK